MARSDFLQSLVEHGIVHESEAEELPLRYGNKDFDIAIGLYGHLSLPDDRELLGHLYGTSIGKAYVPLARTLFQAEALEKLVRDMALKLQCIPIYYLGNVLTCATARPEDEAATATLSRLVGSAVSTVFAFPQEIANYIEIEYGNQEDLQRVCDELSDQARNPDQITPEQLKQFASSAGVVHLVRGLLLYCIKNNASDIHIQPTAKALAIRFRIDGQLHTLLTLGSALKEPLLIRLKVLSGLNVVERRLPQDGRVSLELRDKSYDFRLSTVPTAFGEKAVLRAIGSSDQVVKSLDELGLSRRNRKLLGDMIKVSHGVLYVTGPTGSGKTTTLYSALSSLNTPDINIVTVEDPVELRIDGLSQIQVNTAVELDFPRSLRAILRQDPEVVLVGEIRDLETARIASQAALTGHLVMTTLHTNNSFQAITRLVDIGLDPYLVAPSVIGVVAQRLVRRICLHCKEKYAATADVLNVLFKDWTNEEVYFYRGRGCEACGNSGYAGRIAVHEIFVVTDGIRDMITKHASITEIEREAVRHGFTSMRYDGILKALQGLTTVDEVERVTAAVKRQG
ncbi:GspE/PulE family protein [Dyella sp. RRB7]|uniref:GspE/PulE family protein n=1 Tax=Dyella sp. RRB7 TaxID=2919502 RepID=UPI001FA9BDC2|nr:GspE/PulE family protein [Dyella sp. RRB7]